MICCYDCGEVYESKCVDDIVQVYDEEKDTWGTTCPNCGSDDLFEEEFEVFDQEDTGYDE